MRDHILHVDVYDIVASEFVVEKSRTSLDLFIATKACKSAVRICQPLDTIHMKKIIGRLSKLENPWVRNPLLMLDMCTRSKYCLCFQSVVY